MRVELPEGFTARPVAPNGDLEDVTAVVAACELADDGEVEIEAEDIGSDWRRPSFDPSSDAVVVLDAGRVVGYAEVFAGRAWVRVHPRVRDRGIGATLLRWSEARAVELGAGKLGQTVSDNDGAAATLLLSNGYVFRWHSWILRKALDDEPPVPQLPQGISLRTFEPGRDDRAVHELIDVAFSDWPDRDPGHGFEDWAASYLHRRDFDPGLTFLLEDGGELVGVSLSQAFDDEGYVHQLAVRRSHRGRGLGGSLLRVSFREFHRRGLRTAGLSTESRTGARGVYEHVGMRIVRSYTRYSKDL